MIKIKTIASSSAGCCYVIESGGEQLLIECGIPLNKIRKALGFDLSKVVGCLISHEHKDHCHALQEIDLKMRFPVHGPLSVRGNFNTLYKYHCVEYDKYKRRFCCGENFTIKPFFLNHDVDCFGYVIWCGEDVLFYVTDTGSIDYNFKGITYLMIEANYSTEILLESDRHDKLIQRSCEYHLDIADAITFAESQKETLKEVHLLHLSDEHSDEGLFKFLMQQATGVPVDVAKKGV